MKTSIITINYNDNYMVIIREVMAIVRNCLKSLAVL